MMHILIAEDEGINRLYLSSFLIKKGYSVDEAGNGKAAVSKYASGNYDLVLMDIGMPIMNGIEAVRHIRTIELDENRKKTPIFALTAHTLPRDLEEYELVGIDDVIGKPLKERLLIEKIKSLN